MVDLCAAPGSWSQVLSQRLNVKKTGGGRNGESNRHENDDAHRLDAIVSSDKKCELDKSRVDCADKNKGSSVNDDAGKKKSTDVEDGACYKLDQDSSSDKSKLDGREERGAQIVAVDLQLMAPIPGVVQIQGDITKVHISHEFTPACSIFFILVIIFNCYFIVICCCYLYLVTLFVVVTCRSQLH